MRWLLNSIGATPEHPGQVLLRVYMEPHAMSQNALARRMGVAPRLVNEIVQGKRAITARTALLLAQVYGGDGMDWLERQALWDLYLARRGLRQHGVKVRPLRRHRHDAEVRRRYLAARMQAQAEGERSFREWQGRMRAWLEGGRLGPPPRPG
jgi:antitoxin HigA-1